MNLYENFRLKAVSKRTLLVSVLLSFGTVMVSSEINILIEKIIPIPQSFLNLETLLSPESTFSMVLIFLTIVLIAPIGEEMVLEFLQRYLEEHWATLPVQFW